MKREPDMSRGEELAFLSSIGEATAAQEGELRAALDEDEGLREFYANALYEESWLRGEFNGTDVSTTDIPSRRLEAVLATEVRPQEAQANNDNADRKIVPLFVKVGFTLAAVFIVGLFVVQQFPGNGPAASGAVAMADPAWSPRGLTGLTQPTIVWENAADQAYDVWILPANGEVAEVEALYVAKGVRSPVAFEDLELEAATGEALEPGQDYRALVCLASMGRLAGTAIAFRVSETARADFPEGVTSPAGLVYLARRLVEEGRANEALSFLVAAPVAWVDAEPEIDRMIEALRPQSP